MKKIISVICAVVLLLSSVSVSAFALTKTEADEDLAAQNAIFKEIISERTDINNSGAIDAADARLVLLYSAGLKTDGMNVTGADIDRDGKVTAIDARIFLRLAAQLEKVEDHLALSDTEKFSYFLSIINSIKPNGYSYYQSSVETTEKINYTDKKGVIADIDRQFAIYADMDDSMKGFSFGNEIKASEGDKYSPTGSNITTLRRIQNSNYPIKDNALAFLATLDDIKKIEYQTNQTCVFSIYNSNHKNLRYTDTITGLDSFTVYLKDDAKVSLTDNTVNKFGNTFAGKALDILKEDEIDESIVGDFGLDSITGMDDLGICEIEMTPKTLQYHDCYVKVYFYPETGIPVATEHNLNYTLSLNMDMFIDFDPDNIEGVEGMGWLLELLLIKNKGKILYVDGDFDLDNTMSTKTSVYLYENNPNHITYAEYIQNK